MRAILLVCALVLTACQSHGDAMRIICNAPNDCEECRTADPAMRAMHLAEYIDGHVSNGEAQEMFRALANADPAMRRTIIEQAAGAEGITECPIVEVFAE